MQQPITVDGATLVRSYEHVSRVIEVAGIPIAGWNEMTGGGIAREGQTDIFGAGDEPRGTTNGRAVPQDITLKLEWATWEQLKTALLLQAIATGDTSATNYQKVSWEIVDQFRGATLFIPSITRTHSVKIKAEAPETPNDGTQFYMTLTLKQNGVPRETQGI